ncbi:helix-turn-helix transcriptional regulator [Methylobacillus sp. Pita2]|uniref:helix-turn-helix transcriptional regulator n=1 Tax=Methylobacillus sp. Pita2 TaxID=3383245 RepID=UPI0038B4639E
MLTHDFITQLTTILKARRLKAGLTQEDLAREVGVRRATVVDIENGKNVTLHNIALIADFLEIQLLNTEKMNELLTVAPPDPQGPKINARLYPQLLSLLWDRKHEVNAKKPVMITAQEAYALYEKQFRFIDIDAMVPKELNLFQRLKKTVGNGVYLAA